jgi:hypothetical protein
MTEDGLRMLLELLSTPKWRNCVECIELVDPGVEALKEDKKGRYCWFGFYKISPTQLTIIRNKVSYRCSSSSLLAH